MVKAKSKRDDYLELISSPELRKAEMLVKRLQSQVNELKIKLKKDELEPRKTSSRSKAVKKKLTGGVKKGRVNREQVSLKVATVNAKIRTAKAKARAIKYALQSRARREAETERAEIALKKAVAAFIAKWKRKREKADARLRAHVVLEVWPLLTDENGEPEYKELVDSVEKRLRVFDCPNALINP